MTKQETCELDTLVAKHGDALWMARLPEACAGQPVIVGIEVGVMAGNLSGYLLRKVPNLYLHMVDRWLAIPPDSPYAKTGDYLAAKTQADFDRYKRIALRRTEPVKSRRFIHHGESADMAKRFLPGTVDFIFVDGDHSFEGVTRDLDTWWPVLRVGGQLGGHDIDVPKPGFKVRQAVEAFIARTCPGTEFQTYGHHSWWMTKPNTNAS